MGQPQRFDDQFKDEMGEYRLPALRLFFAGQILPGYLPTADAKASYIWDWADELAKSYIEKENQSKGGNP